MGAQRPRNERRSALARPLEKLDRLDARFVRVDDDVAQPLTQHGFDGGLQLRGRPHDVGDDALDPVDAAARRAVLLHDRANALLEALVTILNLCQRRQPRAPTVRLLAQRLQLQLAARKLTAQRGQPRFVFGRPSARGVDPGREAIDLVTQTPLLADQRLQPFARCRLLSGHARDPRRQIIAALHRAGALRLAAGDARARGRDVGLRRFQLVARRRQHRAARLLQEGLRLVFALARVGRAVDLRQPRRDLLDVAALLRRSRAQLGHLPAARVDPRRQVRRLRLVMAGALHAQLRLVRQRI